jgi:acetylornithine/N-succinyldiaminopimelate aminotransferase
MIPAVLPTYNRAPIAFVKGDGSWLTAEDGSRYLDLGGGIAVNALGHAHPALVAALTEQAQKLWHVSNVYRIPEQERLAAMLTDLTFADTVFFTNSGTETAELAIKMARKFHYENGGRVPWPVDRGYCGGGLGKDGQGLWPPDAGLSPAEMGRP